MKAKKSLGQHFLAHQAIAEKIAYALLPLDNVKRVVEVGPGKGMLTKFLLDRYPDLVMIETDIDMIQVLQETFPDHKDQMVHADFLKVNLPALMGEPFSLIGNFPYNISSQILFKMLDHRPLIPQMVGMFQREVAERVASSHGNKQYGILSVLIQTYYQVERIMHVSPGSFKPPPKVDSTVIRLTAREHVDTTEALDKRLRQLVKLAFNQRRKMLRNSIKSLWPDYLDPDDPVLQLRPEQISVAGFLALARRMISLPS